MQTHRASISTVIVLTILLFCLFNTFTNASLADKHDTERTNTNDRSENEVKRRAMPEMTPRPKHTAVSPGNWGGAGVRLVVQDGTTAIAYVCAQGEITEKLTIDNDGRFDARGVHINRSPGPLYEDKAPKQLAARYSGRIVGNKMTLRVVLIDTNTLVGDFELELGKQVRLLGCH
jgi:hypothetical protein